MNDEESIPDGKYLGTISQDFVKIADTLKEASYQIRKRGFEYPVFAICKEPQPIGQLLVQADSLGTTWHYYASFLDEFTQRGLVEDPEKFTQSYKDPDEFCCLFVIDREFMNFVYIPYPED